MSLLKDPVQCQYVNEAGIRCPEGTRHQTEFCVPHRTKEVMDAFVEIRLRRRAAHKVAIYRLVSVHFDEFKDMLQDEFDALGLGEVTNEEARRAYLR